MRIVKNYSLLAFALLLMGMVTWSCNTKDDNDSTVVATDKSVASYDHSVVSSWNSLFLEIERYAAGYRPGPAPRALAYTGLAAYEACITGMPNYNSIAASYAGLDIPKVQTGLEYHWPTVVNSTNAYLYRRFFASVNADLYAKIGALESQNNALYASQASEEILTRSRTYGQDVATAVWNYSKTDVIGHDAYLNPFKDYDWNEHYDGPGDWVPTKPGPDQPMFGNWGKTRVFAINEADKLCPPPIPYSENTNSAFFNQGMEVYANTVNGTYEGIWIGEFWSDDLINLTFSPGPRWLAVADQAYFLDKSSLEKALYANAKVGLSLNDAAVACWHSKYYYNVERPESYIQRVIDPNWEPLLFNPLTNQAGNTPAFPAYPSGHSTMGAAAAEVLTDIFGIHFPMTDNCHANRTDFEGKPRAFNTFYEMAVENAWSRVPLGVHFRMDCEQGVNLGYRCGRKVNQIKWKK